MTDFLTSLSQAAFHNNLVLIQLLGLSAFMAGSVRLRPALELAQLLFVIMVSACAVNLVLHQLLLKPLGIGALQLPLFAVCGAGIASLYYKMLQSYFPMAARRQDMAVLLFGGSSAVVGTSLMATAMGTGIVAGFAFSLGSAIGYCMLLILFAALRERLDSAGTPMAFRGAPGILICAGILSLCLLILQQS